MESQELFKCPLAIKHSWRLYNDVPQKAHIQFYNPLNFPFPCSGAQKRNKKNNMKGSLYETPER